jgi:hypothetical protein
MEWALLVLAVAGLLAGMDMVTLWCRGKPEDQQEVLTWRCEDGREMISLARRGETYVYVVSPGQWSAFGRQLGRQLADGVLTDEDGHDLVDAAVRLYQARRNAEPVV